MHLLNVVVTISMSRNTFTIIVNLNQVSSRMLCVLYTHYIFYIRSNIQSHSMRSYQFCIKSTRRYAEVHISNLPVLHYTYSFTVFAHVSGCLSMRYPSITHRVWSRKVLVSPSARVPDQPAGSSISTKSHLRAFAIFSPQVAPLQASIVFQYRITNFSIPEVMMLSLTLFSQSYWWRQFRRWWRSVNS